MNCSVHAPYQLHANEANGHAPAEAADPDNVRADQAGAKPGRADGVFDERFLAGGIRADGLDGHALDEAERAVLLHPEYDDPAAFQDFRGRFRREGRSGL